MKPAIIDASTLTWEQIEQAIKDDCHYWGSFAYYTAAQIEKAKKDPAGVVAYRDWLGRLRAYYRSPEQRETNRRDKRGLV